MTPRSLQLALIPLLLPLTAIAQDAAARADYAQGHSAAQQGRFAEAVETLRRVPQGDELFPYAARAMLYSAWQSGLAQLFVDTAQALVNCGNAEVEKLATASLAEYQLCVLEVPESASIDAVAALHRLAAKDASLQPTMAWLEARQMLLRGQLDAAETACREIDANRAYPQTVRHRARLILAEVLYAREAQAELTGETYTPAPKTKPAETQDHAADDDDDEPAAEEETPQTLEGKGEETLLSFITANPDSPLLGEAFRILKAHRAFERSEIARTRLDEWAKDTAGHARRATLALLVLQHILNRDDAPDAPLDTTCASTTANAYPQEPATGIILLEQIRSLYLRGRTEEARSLLGALPPNLTDARANQYAALWRAMLQEDVAGQPWRGLLEETAHLGGSLPQLVRRNAFIHTLESGADAKPDPAAPPVEQARMHLLSARHALLSANPDLHRAEGELHAVLDSPQADAETAFQARLLLCETAARRGHADALDQAEALHGESMAMPVELRLQYFTVLEHAFLAARTRAEARECMIAELQDTLTEIDLPPELSLPLRLHLASLLTISRSHREEARELLQRMIAEAPRSDYEPLALLMLGECTAQGNTPAALREAIALFERAAARGDKPTVQQARIRRADVLVRLGNTEDAAQDMRRLLREDSPAPKEDSMARLVLANALANGDAADRAEALDCLQQPVDNGLEALPRNWQFMVLKSLAIHCARLGEADRAIANFRRILAMEPALHARNADDEEWRELYGAAISAAYLLEERGDFNEALEILDRTAKWNTAAAPEGSPRIFMKWAASIRQEYPDARK